MEKRMVAKMETKYTAGRWKRPTEPTRITGRPSLIKRTDQNNRTGIFDKKERIRAYDCENK